MYMRKEQFDITGMTCSACSSRVEGCVVKLDEKKAKVKLNQDVADEVFKTAIEDAGYQLAEIA